MAEVRQNLPAPRCGVTNSFTGVVVEQGSGNSSSAARTDAVQTVQATRAAGIAIHQALVCPADCASGPASQITVGSGGIQTVEVNPDAGTWVAQHRGHWMVELRCNGNFDSVGLAPETDFVVDRHEEPLVCGKTRRSLGCVIGKAVAAGSLRARNEAKDIAKTNRDLLLAEDEAKTCPEGCFEEPVTSSRSGSRLIMARQIRQARGASRIWVAYAIAWWSVTHECIPVEKTKKERDEYPREQREQREQDELEYFDSAEDIEEPSKK